MAETTEGTTTETKAETQSLDERVLQFATEQWESAATEGAAAKTETTEAQAAETTEDTEVEKPEEPAAWTTEQLRDPKFYDTLDKAGWERLKTDHPEVYGRVNAAYSAASKIYDAAKKTKTEAPITEQRPEAPTQKSLSPETKAALAKANSLNDEEAAEGLQQLIKLTLADALPEFGFDPVEAKNAAMERAALAVAIQEMPEIKTYSEDDLAAAIRSNPSLLRMVALVEKVADEGARVELAASILLGAGQSIAAQRKATADTSAAQQRVKDEKTKETQRKVRSNANIASNVIVEQPSGSSSKAKKSMEERVHELYAEAASGNG